MLSSGWKTDWQTNKVLAKGYKCNVSQNLCVFFYLFSHFSFCWFAILFCTLQIKYCIYFVWHSSLHGYFALNNEHLQGSRRLNKYMLINLYEKYKAQYSTLRATGQDLGGGGGHNKGLSSRCLRQRTHISESLSRNAERRQPCSYLWASIKRQV